MRWWPWGRRRGPSPEVLAEQEKTAQSLRDLQATQEKTPEIQALSDRMVRLRERNHFGEQLAVAMMKGPKP